VSWPSVDSSGFDFLKPIRSEFSEALGVFLCWILSAFVAILAQISADSFSLRSHIFSPLFCCFFSLRSLEKILENYTAVWYASTKMASSDPPKIALCHTPERVMKLPPDDSFAYLFQSFFTPSRHPHSDFETTTETGPLSLTGHPFRFAGTPDILEARYLPDSTYFPPPIQSLLLFPLVPPICSGRDK